MNEKIKKIYNTNNIFKGIIISLLFTFIALLILSAILTYTSLSEKIGDTSIIVINAISILLGSSIATIKQKKNGLIKGAIFGICYILIMYICSSIINFDFTLNLNSIIMIISSIFSGIIGGIIGINLNK